MELTKKEIEANAKHYRMLVETGWHEGKPIPQKHRLHIMVMCQMWEKELQKMESPPPPPPPPPKRIKKGVY